MRVRGPRQGRAIGLGRCASCGPRSRQCRAPKLGRCCGVWRGVSCLRDRVQRASTRRFCRTIRFGSFSVCGEQQTPSECGCAHGSRGGSSCERSSAASKPARRQQGLRLPGSPNQPLRVPLRVASRPKLAQPRSRRSRQQRPRLLHPDSQQIPLRLPLPATLRVPHQLRRPASRRLPSASPGGWPSRLCRRWPRALSPITAPLLAPSAPSQSA